jgi:hypothetical protein
MAGEIDPKAAEDLAKSVQAIKASTIDATKAFEEQLRIITQMRDVMSQMAGNLDGMGKQGQTGLLSPDGWAQVSKNIKSTTEHTSKAAGVMEKLGKIMKSPVTSAAIVMAGAFTGLVQGFKNLGALGKGVFNVLGSIAESAFAVGHAIVSIPFKMLDGLIGMASKGGDNSYAVALEEVRDQFGSLKSESSRAVLDIAHNMDKMNQTGVSATSIFGNMAERVKAVNELAKGMGSTFQVFQKEIEQNGVAIMMYQKGLGLTDEQMGAIGSTAMRMGKGVAEIQNDMTKQALGMSKAFGLNAKVLSKDMGKAMADLAHFGHLSSKEMAVSAAFAQKLGVSVDKLTGIMDATSTFDQTAEGMSKLNETFGTNIDSTKMMMAQTPAAKLEILRKEFAKTGKSLESMNMQERMLIKQSSGMSDEMLNAALSSKNAGVSLDKLDKQGEKNEKKTLSQADAMHELADSIKKIPQSGASGGSFLDHIINGFSRGVQSSGVFMKLMRNIQGSLREATMFGVRMGKMFVDMFPGVKDIFGGLGDIFNPSRFRKMFGEIMKVFDVFKAGGTGKMEDFMSRIKEVFLDFFNTQEGPGQKVLGGFKKFGETVAIIFGKMSEWVMIKLAGIVTDITAWLKSPPKIPGAAGGISDGIKKPFEAALSALSEKLMPALKDFVSTLASKLFTAIKESGMAKKIGIGMAAVVMGPAIMGIAGSLVTAGVMKKAGTSLVGGLTTGATQASKLMSAANATAPGGGTDAQKVGVTNEALQQGIPSQESQESMESAGKSNISWAGVTKFVVGLAGFYYVAKQMFAAALEMVKGVAVADIASAGLVMIAISAMMVPAASAMKTISEAGSANFGKVMLALFGIGLMMEGGLSILFKAIDGIKKNNVGVKDLATTALLFLEVGGVIAIAVAVVKVAEKVSDISAALKGLVAIGIVVAAMGVTAVAMLVLTALASPSRISAVGDLMLKMSATFLIASAVVVAAAAIGLVTNPVTAALAVVGLAAIGTTILAMAAMTLLLMTQLNDMPAGSALEGKTKAFSNVMDSVTNLAAQIANILKGLDFGFFESEASKAKKLGLVTGMIKTLLNGDDNKGGLQGIITSVIAGMQTLTPDKIATANALSNVLNSVGSVMSTITGSIKDMQSESTHWYSVTDKSTEQSLVMKSVGAMMTSTMTGIKDLISQICTSISQIQNPEAFAKAAPAVISILSASGSLISAIAPKVSEFQKETNSPAARGVTLKNASVDGAGLTAMADSIRILLSAMATSIPSLVEQIVNVAGKISIANLQKIPIIIEIIKAVATFMSAAGNLGGTKTTEIKDGDKVTKIAENMPTLNSLIVSLQDGLPKVIDAMVALVGKLPKGFSSKIGSIKEITTAMKAVGELMSALNDPFKGVTATGQNDKGANNHGDTVVIRLTDLKIYIDKMAAKDVGLPSVLTAASKLVTSATSSMGWDLSTGIKSITTVFVAIGELMTSLNDPFAGVTAPLGLRGDTVMERLKALKKYIDLMSADADGLPAVIKAAATLESKSAAAGTISGSGFKGFADSVKQIVESMNDICTQVITVQDKAIDTAKITTLNTNMQAVPGLLAGNFTNITTELTTNVIKSSVAALRAVQQMVALTQAVDTSLSKLPNLNLGTKLEAVAKGAGLGGSAVYTVQGKDVVINVAFTVTMDVGTVENIIINRKESVIRDRINYAIKNAAADPKKDSAYIRPRAGANGTPVAGEVGN